MKAGTKKASKPGSRSMLNRRLILIIWPFLAIVALLVVLFMESIVILSAGRAYVEGESLWSKAQKQSLVHLMRYAHTHAETDYQKFLSTLAAPLGDRRARLELEKEHPDYAVAFQGFREGRNHPDDIPGMIMLFRRFRHLSYLDRSITLWADGDKSIDQFIAVAEELHGRIASGERDPERLYAIVDKIFAVDAQLTPEEDMFSASLGEATRATKLLLSIAALALAGTLVPLGILFSRRMLKHGQSFEQALELSEERFNLAVTGSNDGIWDWDLITRNVYYSPRFNELIGCADRPLERTPHAFASRLHPEDRELSTAVLRAHLRRNSAYDVELRVKGDLGEYRWFRVRGQSVRDIAGKAIRMAGSITDITDRKSAEAELYSEKERAQVTLQSIGDAVITTDTNGLVEYLNPAAETLTGWQLREALGLPLLSLIKLMDEKTRRTSDPVEVVLREGQTIEISTEIVLVRRDGSEIAVAESASPIRDRSRHATGVVLVFRDVSRERQYAAKLSYQARHDALTGLVNRREFEIRLRKALATAADDGHEHAVMYLDLDQFKVVNDTCGHAAGDELIRQISSILQRRVREIDTLARLGGDEFGLLVEGCSPTNAGRLADELRQTVEEFPFLWQGKSFSISVSIGLINISGNTFSLAEVLTAADSACYLAKEKGRNRIHVYERNDAELSMRQGEMEWVGRIHQALEEDRLCLYAQEIVPSRGQNSSTGRHIEILVRMIDEKGVLVPPMAFIPAAERYNLMPSIDRWVIRNTFSTLKQMREAGETPSVDLCSINISGASLGDERTLLFAVEQFGQFEIAHATICFEITETAAIANLQKAQHFIQELRRLGCKFSLDDFGAGMSSFAYLKHLSVDYLKIDGSFVKDMISDPLDTAMVESINHIGHVMGKLTIAEFVENDEILARVRELGVDYAQGYGIAKPVPFNEVALRHSGMRQLALLPATADSEQ